MPLRPVLLGVRGSSDPQARCPTGLLLGDTPNPALPSASSRWTRSGTLVCPVHTSPGVFGSHLPCGWQSAAAQSAATANPVAAFTPQRRRGAASGAVSSPMRSDARPWRPTGPASLGRRRGQEPFPPFVFVHSNSGRPSKNPTASAGVELLPHAADEAVFGQNVDRRHRQCLGCGEHRHVPALGP